MPSSKVHPYARRMVDDPDELAAREAWTARRPELEELAVALVGLSTEAARALAVEHGVHLRVCDVLGRVYTRAAVVGRISVDAYGGVVTRAQIG